MHYIQFFQKSAISDDIIEACGDRAVIIVDGRETPDSHDAIAHAEGRKRGFSHFQLFKGETFTRSQPITKRYAVRAK